MIVSPAFAGKRYGVLGLARSGLASAEALLASGAEVLAWDRQEEPRAALEGRATIADPMQADIAGLDALVVSPGVPLNTHPIAERARFAGVPLIGDVELFARARADLPPHRVVAITGTNGKSTAVALVHHILREAGLPTLMAGNIGVPIMDRDPLEANDAGVPVYVLELSSYQIDLTRSLAAEAVALLNITPDHLDRYAGFEDYAFSKGRLPAMQGAGGFFAHGTSDPATRAIGEGERARRTAGRVVPIEVDRLRALQPQWPALRGPHNLQNAAAAIALVEALGVTRATWEPALARFRGLPHRMERIAEHNGVRFVNDSKATNPASAAPALAAFPPDPDARIHWIVGGLAKEDGLGECGDALGNVKEAYTIGEAGPRFADLLEPHVPVQRCEMLCEAVRRAMERARPGDVVLLSPACASFDQFRDFEKRGEAFAATVAALADGGVACPDRSARAAGGSA